MARFNFRDRSRHITKQALQYTNHGWPVAALAVPKGTACPCGDEHAEPHLVSETIDAPKTAAGIWSDGHPWDVALVCRDFDVVELPTEYGAPLYNRLVTTCPTMTVYRGRRWSFVVEAGSFPRDMITRAGGQLHSGPGQWAAAAPSRIDGVGSLYWVVGPLNTRWQPYRRTDAVDSVFRDRGPT